MPAQLERSREAQVSELAEGRAARWARPARAVPVRKSAVADRWDRAVRPAPAVKRGPEVALGPAVKLGLAAPSGPGARLARVQPGGAAEAVVPAAGVAAARAETIVLERRSRRAIAIARFG
jgi:hypothetical protein